MVEIKFKTCTICAIIKPVTEFYTKKNGSLTAACKDCKNFASRANHQKRQSLSEKQRKQRWRGDNRASQLDKHLQRKFNLTLAEWDAMYEAQGRHCAFPDCDKAYSGYDGRTGLPRRLHVDHNHACCPGQYSCGKCIRGLLCSAHNVLISLRENPEFFKISEYLDRWEVVP